MGPRQSSAAADRFSTFAAAGGVVLGMLYLATAFLERADLVGALAARAVPALALAAGGVALGWIGSRVGMLLWRVNDLSRQQSAGANDLIADLRQVADRLEALATGAPPPKAPGRPPATATQAPAPAPASPDEPYEAGDSDDDDHDDGDDALPDPLPSFVPEPGVPATPVPADAAEPGRTAQPPGGLAADERVIALLEEIREVALMDDEQRRARLQQHRDTRRRAGLAQVTARARAGQWAAADELLAALEIQFAGDATVAQARAEFDRQREAAEPDALFRTEQHVRDLVQASAWDRAVALSNEFLANYPASADGRRLLAEVHREHASHRDAAFHRLYEQVQSNVDRRQWRAAHADARRLLEQCPDHPRAGRIRQQIQTIAANAEIEERQEQEVRIQLLVKNQRFAEAVELAEDVIRRFPNSPQADALEARLPQLRELAEFGEGDGN